MQFTLENYYQPFRLDKNSNIWGILWGILLYVKSSVHHGNWNVKPIGTILFKLKLKVREVTCDIEI